MTPSIRFVTVDEVRVLHRQVIDQYGGHHGVRDERLLESAVMAPQQTFGGKYLYASLSQMAAVYWTHLVQNHPFLDGNKRIGFRTADVFLLLNGWRLTLPAPDVVTLSLQIALHTIDQDTLAHQIEQALQPLP